MKKTILTIWLCVVGLMPAMAQGRLTVADFLAGYREGTDTVRAALAGVSDPERITFRLEENGDTLTVQLGGKPKDITPGFYALDVRPGDTLTVAGVHRKKPKKDAPQMVSATVLSIDYAADHDERIGYYFSLDEKPSFQGGGTKAFSNWVTSRLVYPESSRQQDSEGTVRLKFTIDKSGNLTDLEVLKSSGDVLLDAEAVRVVLSAPAWTPGMIRGKPVKVTYVFPVLFQLRDPKSKTH